jgi:short-subunit dehydrogenase
VCVVVGVGPGIGLAVAKRFAREGYAVGMLARHADRLDALAAEVEREGGRASAIQADAADTVSLGAALDRLRAELGDADVLVYNASSSHGGPPSALRRADLESDFRVCVTAALESVQRVLPPMRVAGRGTILLTGGGLALQPVAAMASLAIGKAGLRALALALADELAPAGIHVATVTVAGFVQPGTALDPDAIAEHYWRLHAQPAGAWEREVVLR